MSHLPIRLLSAVTARVVAGVVVVGVVVVGLVGALGWIGWQRSSQASPIAAVDVPSQTEAGVADPRAPSPALFDPSVRPTSVAMVGDSITVAAADELAAALEAGGLEVLIIDAQVGRRMTVNGSDQRLAGVEAVDGIVGAMTPDLWVVALGTNDIGQYTDVDELRRQITELLDRIPVGVPLVWIDTWIRDRPDQARLMNEAIRAEVGRRPGSLVVDWATHAVDDGVLSSDGVHLSDRLGRPRFAEVVAGGVEALIGPAG